ncbi:MAG: GNAT family N-acetyltransferase [Nocardioides sp.]|nr:GNAT family N-acetyltransferase [Nocardioides sp.]
MADFDIRMLAEDEWRLYRDIRMAALREAPQAFAASVAEEAAHDEDVWRDRMTHARRFVAEREDEALGVVCLGLHNDDQELGEVFGLWTAPSVRGHHVGWGLVASAARRALEDGRRLLYYWVRSDNGPGIGFASSFGFRPTSQRRSLVGSEPGAEAEADEVAMVMSLSADPTMSRNPYIE